MIKSFVYQGNVLFDKDECGISVDWNYPFIHEFSITRMVLVSISTTTKVVDIIEKYALQ